MEWLDLFARIFDSLMLASDSVLTFLSTEVDALGATFSVYELMFGGGLTVFLLIAVVYKFLPFD